MSCSTSCSPKCPCKFAPWFPRAAFGLILVAYGVNHYRHFTDFLTNSKGPFINSLEGVTPVTYSLLGSVAGILAYIVPALMIVGGLLFAVKQMSCISKVCILASLSGIIGWASIAVLLGGNSAGMDMMPAIQNAALLLVVYWVIKKMSCCGNSCVKPVATV